MNFIAIGKGMLAGFVVLSVLQFLSSLGLPWLLNSGSVPAPTLLVLLVGARLVILLLAGMTTGYVTMRCDATRSLLNAALAGALLQFLMALWAIESMQRISALAVAIVYIGVSAGLGVAGAYLHVYQSRRVAGGVK